MRNALFAAALAAAALATTRAQAADGPATTSPGKVFELRTYVTNEGKLEALHKRFRDHTCKLFEKHGIELIGFWTPTQGEASKNTLVYLVAFPSAEAQTKAWTAFKSDPAWIRAKADSETDGVLVKKVESLNLAGVDYSPLR